MVDSSELVGTAEIAQRLGVAKNTVYQWERRALGFPNPVVELELVRIWVWPEIESWARTTNRLQ